MREIRYNKIPGHGHATLPGITSMIALYADCGMLGDNFIPKSETGAIIGRQSHDVIKRINEGQKIGIGEWNGLPEKTRNAVKAFLRWKKAVGFIPRLSETLVYSLKYGIAGHVDAIGTIRPKILTVCDWKLGDIHNERILMQIPTYGFCYLEMFPRRKIYGFGGVHLDPLTGNYEEIRMSLDEGWNHFQEFLRLKIEVGIV